MAGQPINQPIYLDNAATSFPKPECVYAAQERYQRHLGVAVGRGAYRQAIEVSAEVQRCRLRAAQLLRAEGPERIIFTFNGTDSLNMAIHGILRPGDHVVTTQIEHNSVLRPLHFLKSQGQIELDVIPVGRDSVTDPEDIRRTLRPNTRLIAMTHASNVSGVIQPCEVVGRMAREAGIYFLVDAAQTAGHLPIDVRQLHADLLACPGHKGLLGPLGTGLLYVRPGVEQQLRSVRQGGTGTQSEDEQQPETLPDKYESGNHNGPGLFGLSAGLQWLLDPASPAGLIPEAELMDRLLKGLQAIPGLEVHGPATSSGRVGVVSISVADAEPQIVATLLDEMAQVQVRSGLHCAPGAHRALCTFDRGGTVRLSVGRFNTLAQIDQAVEALGQIAASL